MRNINPVGFTTRCTISFVTVRATLLRRLAGLGAALVLAAAVNAEPVIAASATSQPIIDCPLREQAYSVNSPLMDILLKPEAVALADRYMGGVLQKIPSTFASSQAPSFSAIITLKTVASMAQFPTEALGPLDQQLAALEISAADRQARCARYDVVLPNLKVPNGKPRLLLFEKMTGYRDGPSVDAARTALHAMAAENGWAMVTTELGAAIHPAILQQFDAVIWNNVSGDVLTLTQRKAFEDYINNGGGYVGIHGSAGDPNYFWDWYVEELIGARFLGHPMDPQFQDARIVIDTNAGSLVKDLASGWTLNDEWYSFRTSPRASGATVIASLDEASYSQVGRYGQDLRMGEDHPIAWTRCVGGGRSFYSAIGHRPEVYTDVNHLKLLQQGIAWAAGKGPAECGKSDER